MSKNHAAITCLIAAVLIHTQITATALSPKLTQPAVIAVASQMNDMTSANRFGEAEFYYKAPGQSKAQPVRGSLVFDSGKKAVRFFSEAGMPLDVPYTSVTNLIYERTSKPRYALGILVAWPLLFTKSKKHYLTIQYKSGNSEGQYALIRLDKNNYQSALAAAESQTGVKVDRSEEK